MLAEASSDLAEAVLHQKEARIGINDPTVSGLRERLDVGECWKKHRERACLATGQSSARAAKRVVALTKTTPLHAPEGQRPTKYKALTFNLNRMIDYRRRLYSCDLSSVPEIRDVKSAAEKWGGRREEAARSPDNADSLSKTELLQATLLTLKQKDTRNYYYNLWF